MCRGIMMLISRATSAISDIMLSIETTSHHWNYWCVLVCEPMVVQNEDSLH